MTITRWEPFSFPSFFDRPNLFHSEDWWRNFHAAQGLDVYETDGEIVIEAAVPGVDIADISVDIDDNLLTIQAEHQEKKDEKGNKEITHQSSHRRSFHYVVTLRKPVDESRAKAVADNGILKVTLPKAKKEKETRTIKVEGVDAKD